jgi:hypothetical protein
MKTTMGKTNLENNIDVIELLENYIQKIRPPEEIRDELDIYYKIEKQSIFLFEIRPDFLNPKSLHQYNYAKATFVKSSNKWKVYWLRANHKWYVYQPEPEVATLNKFLDLVEEDKFGCFKG